tara:strand:+ start:29 stop:1660 length:1632 start_codon:yes stop_codon:yes gene_type:complete
MAITYQAGRRIQGLERTGSTPTYETDFSSNAGWTTTNSSYLNVDTSGEKLDFLINTGSLNDEIYRDLGAGFGSTSFVVRAKLHITSILLNTTAGQAAGFDIGLSDTSTISSEQPTNDITYFHINAGSADVANVIKAADGSSNSNGNSVSNAPFNISSDGSDFWIQLWRNGDVFSCQLYTDSSYSSPTGALFTVTKTSVSALQFFFLRVFSQGVSGGNLVEGYIDDLKIYDGITSVVAAAGDVKPTNVQVGSRFEETDTRKMYHYNASADITTDGSYTVLQYKSDGTFTPTSAFNVEYLVVAGGGGGAGNCGGGGGSGGYRTATGHAVTAQSYGITVGGAGIAGLQLGSAGDGGDSTFDTITSNGGGGGSTNAAGSGAAGGSGGGTGGDQTNAGGAGNTPSTSPSQGNNGGAGYIGGGAGSGGGGGGSTAVGVAGVSGVSGAGGAGTSSSITGSAVTRSGGGGAGECHNGSSGAGGTGGGGAGGDAAVGNAATVNTGSGGGGGGNAGVGYAGGSGGSGIVILRFLTSGNTYTTSLANVWTEEGT